MGCYTRPQFDYFLKAQTSRTFQLSTSGDVLQVGFAEVVQTDPNIEDKEPHIGTISGSLSFCLFSGEALVSQIGVEPATAVRSVFLTFDNRGGNRTGLAVAAFEDIDLKLTLFDEIGVKQGWLCRMRPPDLLLLNFCCERS